MNKYFKTVKSVLDSNYILDFIPQLSHVLNFLPVPIQLDNNLFLARFIIQLSWLLPPVQNIHPLWNVDKNVINSIRNVIEPSLYFMWGPRFLILFKVLP